MTSGTSTPWSVASTFSLNARDRNQTKGGSEVSQTWRLRTASVDSNNNSRSNNIILNWGLGGGARLNARYHLQGHPSSARSPTTARGKRHKWGSCAAGVAVPVSPFPLTFCLYPKWMSTPAPNTSCKDLLVRAVMGRTEATHMQVVQSTN